MYVLKPRYFIRHKQDMHAGSDIANRGLRLSGDKL
jgi:hypothetical protein